MSVDNGSGLANYFFAIGWWLKLAAMWHFSQLVLLSAVYGYIVCSILPKIYLLCTYFVMRIMTFAICLIVYSLPVMESGVTCLVPRHLGHGFSCLRLDAVLTLVCLVFGSVSNFCISLYLILMTVCVFINHSWMLILCIWVHF